MKTFSIFVLSFVCSLSLAATVRFKVPTTNTDGSALTNLAGFRILYGSSPTELTNSLLVANPAAASATIPTPSSTNGGLFCAVRAYTTAGIESDNSAVASLAPTVPVDPPLMSVVGREVFYVVQQTDKFVFLPVGTVKTATACDRSQPVGVYNVIPRATVTWYGNVQPLVVVTKCD